MSPARPAGRWRKKPRPLLPRHWAYPCRAGIRRTRNLVETTVFQSDRAELPSPDATGVEQEQRGAHAQTERGPVPANQGVIRALPALHFKPGKIARWGLRRFAFAVKFHGAFGRTEAHARHRVRDDAKPVRAL